VSGMANMRGALQLPHTLFFAVEEFPVLSRSMYCVSFK